MMISVRNHKNLSQRRVFIEHDKAEDIVKKIFVFPQEGKLILWEIIPLK
jgi:hypothetical protein